MFKKNNDNEGITQQDAFDSIEDWLDFFECRLIGEDREDVKKNLWISVQKERLTLDKSTGIFGYVLISPIEKKDGSKISMIKLQEAKMRDKEDYQKINDSYAKSVKTLQAYCKTSDGEELPAGFIGQISDRDESVISGVILGFFVQAMPD